MVKPWSPNRAAYPLHRDSFVYYHFDGQPEMVWSSVVNNPKAAPALQSAFEGMKPLRRPAGALYHKLRATFNDIIVVFYVIDAVLYQQRGTYIRPTYLLPYLSERQKQYLWTANTVGRVLAGTHYVCSEVYRSYVDEDLTRIPFAQGRDGRGRYYVVDPENGDEGMLWLIKTRGLALEMAQQVMQLESIGKFDEDLGNLMGKLTQPGEWYIEWMPDAIRTRDAFLAQLDPGRHFSQVQPAEFVGHEDVVFA